MICLINSQKLTVVQMYEKDHNFPVSESKNFDCFITEEYYEK